MPEEPDPDQTLFFKRRKQSVNFLPLIVICALVLGSGALVVWAVNQSGRHSVDDLAAQGHARSVRRAEDDPFQRSPRDRQRSSAVADASSPPPGATVTTAARPLPRPPHRPPPRPASPATRR